MSNVTAIYGGPTGEPTVNENCVSVLEGWLEKAKAGEIVAVAGAVMHKDGLSSYTMGGLVGGYSLLGALERAKAEVLIFIRWNEA